MNDLSNLVPIAADALHIGLSTLLLGLGLLHVMFKVIYRKLSDDKAGALGIIRNISGFLGADASSVVTTTDSGKAVTIADAARAAGEAAPAPTAAGIPPQVAAAVLDPEHH